MKKPPFQRGGLIAWLFGLFLVLAPLGPSALPPVCAGCGDFGVGVDCGEKGADVERRVAVWAVHSLGWFRRRCGSLRRSHERNPALVVHRAPVGGSRSPSHTLDATRPARTERTYSISRVVGFIIGGGVWFGQFMAGSGGFFNLAGGEFARIAWAAAAALRVGDFNEFAGEFRMRLSHLGSRPACWAEPTGIFAV